MFLTGFRGAGYPGAGAGYPGAAARSSARRMSSEEASESVEAVGVPVVRYIRIVQ